MTPTCINKLGYNGSDSGLFFVQRQAIWIKMPTSSREKKQVPLSAKTTLIYPDKYSSK